MSITVYQNYFNIDPKYYAAVTADLIESGKVSWKNFYPHETFIKLLEKTYTVLSGKDPRSLWVEGAYGTGKSHAVLTVKSLLEASNEEFVEYFRSYGLNMDLCKRLISIKNTGKLITLHRIGSSSIRSDRDLIYAVQESIMNALADHGIENQGEVSLKDAALKWFEKKANSDYFNELISEEQYAWKFGGQKVDSIIYQLQNGSPENIQKTMRDIMSVAEDNGITALRLDIQGMVSWIKSIIEDNQLTGILFIWDEFSEYFINNLNSLSGFQALVEISLSHPFYFMIVSHEIGGHYRLPAAYLKKISDRFVPSITIKLPENMAFRLMAQAMKTTNDIVLKKEWENYKSELNEDIGWVRSTIRNNINKSDQKMAISDEELQNIIPIHPYAALLLKHLSVTFSSNQRSMFDFIISTDPDIKAFRWFIANYGPLDALNLITVDMLWDFFSGKNRNKMDDDVRVIFDSYCLLDSDSLSFDEQRVLKTILILQAVCVKVSYVEILKPNENNVELAFGGTGWGRGKARSIAEKLVRDGLLFKRPIGGGKEEYTIANSTGDAATIQKKKEEVINTTKTQDLLSNADLLNAVVLPVPISGRFVREAAATKNFSLTLNKLISMNASNRFKALITFAKDDEEAAQLKNQILQSIRSGKSDILFIDAGLTPMGKDLFDQYVESMAYSLYYSSSDKHRAREYQSQADRCLTEWKEKIQAGAFMLYDEERPSGIRLANLAALQDELSALNHKHYPYGLEQFNVIANMFNKGPLAQGAECAMTGRLVGTYKAPNEKTSLATALAGAWNVEKYWEDPAKKTLPIVKIKLEVEKLIEKGFAERSARVSMTSIYEALKGEPFGFMPNNITAFVLGFVLKEYANTKYFWSNGSNNEPMTTEKMKTMIANVINQEVSPGRNFREEFIVAMSENQRAFLDCTARAFHISSAQCSSVESARDQIRIRMKNLEFPIWCVKYALSDIEHAAPTEKLAAVIDDYCSIANTGNGNRGNESEVASDIGKTVIAIPAIADDLARVLTNENCIKGMLAYIDQFQEGILRQLAVQIGDNGAYLGEVKKKFSSAEANWVWSADTANDKIKEVILDYQIIVESNKILPKCMSIQDVVNGWNEKTNNIRISYEAVKRSVGDLAPFLEILHSIKQNNSLPDQKKEHFYNLLLTQREPFERFYSDQVTVFRTVASSFLGDLDGADISSLYSLFPSGQFTKSAADYYRFVEQQVSDYQNGQLKKKIRDLWKEKTDTNDPYDWSARFRTPILCMFNDEERAEAREIFEIMRDNFPSKASADRALRYLSNANFYSRLVDQNERDRCFTDRIIGEYKILLKDPQVVRNYIENHSTERVYNWIDNLTIQNLIKSYADKLYKTGGYEQAWSVIDQMDAGTLRDYLKDLISDNVKVGIEILKKK